MERNRSRQTRSRAEMLHWAVAVVLVPWVVNCSRKPEKRPPSGGQAETRSAAGLNPAALFIAAERSGRAALFQWLPGSKDPASVLETDGAFVQSAAASQAGTALAVLSKGTDGKRRLRYAVVGPSTRWRTVTAAAQNVSAVRAVSEHGRTIVVQTPRGSLDVYRPGSRSAGPLSIDVPRLGRLMYGVALSPDGSKLAFSTMDGSCATSVQKMATCPVSLYGVDLAKGTGTPRVLASGNRTANYDPHFETTDGSKLTYLTTAGDPSDRCRAHVNGCIYSVRRIGFNPGPDKLVIKDAVLFLSAQDGTLSYRRLGRDSRGHALWSKQTLHVAEAGEPAITVLPGQVQNRYHYFSPDSKWILLQTLRKGVTQMVIVNRKGQVSKAGVAGWSVRPIGWAAFPLRPGRGQMKPPRTVRALRHAVARARSFAGPKGPVAVFDVNEFALSRIREKVFSIPSKDQVVAWLQRAGRGACVMSQRVYCSLPKVKPAQGSALRVLDAVGDTLAVVTAAPQVPKTAGPAPAPDTEPLAVFDATGSGGGAFALLGFDLPRSVRRYQHFPMTLWWKILERPRTDWKVFVHFDGRGMRFLSDHRAGVCGLRHFKVGDILADRFAVEVASGFGEVVPGTFKAYVGWFLKNRRAKVSGTTTAPDNRLVLGNVQVTK